MSLSQIDVLIILKPNKSEYFTLKTDVLSEVTNKLIPNDVLLRVSPVTLHRTQSVR